MSLVTDRLHVATRGDSDIVDLTLEVQTVVTRHGFRQGQVLVFVSG